MSKTITLRLSDEKYRIYKMLAERDNRPISNFIDTAVNKFIEMNELIDEFEMEEIRNNIELNKSIKQGLKDMKNKKGSSKAITATARKLLKKIYFKLKDIQNNNINQGYVLQGIAESHDAILRRSVERS